MKDTGIATSIRVIMVDVKSNYETMVRVAIQSPHTGEDIIRQGYAYCAPTDIFDPEIGFDIAAARAVKLVMDEIERQATERAKPRWDVKIDPLPDVTVDVDLGSAPPPPKTIFVRDDAVHFIGHDGVEYRVETEIASISGEIIGYAGESVKAEQRLCVVPRNPGQAHYSYQAGLDLKAGEPVIIGADGKVYPKIEMILERIGESLRKAGFNAVAFAGRKLKVFE